MNKIKNFRISVWVYFVYYTGDVFARIDVYGSTYLGGRNRRYSCRCSRASRGRCRRAATTRPWCLHRRRAAVFDT